MIRAALVAAALLTTPAVVQAQAPSSAAGYVADFTRLCVDTGGDRAAMTAAAGAAGWTVGQAPLETATAVNMVAFDAPDSARGTLYGSASPAGALDGLTIWTCVLDAPRDAVLPAAEVRALLEAGVGIPGRPTAQGAAWALSRGADGELVNEGPAFAAAGSVDAAFELARARPLMLITLTGRGDQTGLALMRIVPD